MTYVIGVDGGGTRTRAVLVDRDGTEIGRGEGAGAVATAHDPMAATMAVVGAIRAAVEAAAVSLPGAVLWAGLAGTGSEPARRAVTLALTREGVAREVAVGSDAEAAFNDAFRGAGVMLIAGTGSVGWCRSPEGEVRRVGGWGLHLGDEGSGYAIGRAGLSLVAQAHDGRAAPTSLTAALLSRCGVSSPNELIAWAGRAVKSDFAALAPLVIEAADGGDEGAARIATQAVDALEAHLLALDLAPGTEVALWGGLLAGSGPLRGRMLERLAARGWSPLDGEIDPPMGAARLALALAAD